MVCGFIECGHLTDEEEERGYLGVSSKKAAASRKAFESSSLESSVESLESSLAMVESGAHQVLRTGRSIMNCNSGVNRSHGSYVDCAGRRPSI